MYSEPSGTTYFTWFLLIAAVVVYLIFLYKALVSLMSEPFYSNGERAIWAFLLIFLPIISQLAFFRVYNLKKEEG